MMERVKNMYLEFYLTILQDLAAREMIPVFSDLSNLTIYSFYLKLLLPKIRSADWIIYLMASSYPGYQLLKTQLTVEAVVVNCWELI